MQGDLQPHSRAPLGLSAHLLDSYFGLAHVQAVHRSDPSGWIPCISRLGNGSPAELVNRIVRRHRANLMCGRAIVMVCMPPRPPRKLARRAPGECNSPGSTRCAMHSPACGEQVRNHTEPPQAGGHEEAHDSQPGATVVRQAHE